MCVCVCVCVCVCDVIYCMYFLFVRGFVLFNCFAYKQKFIPWSIKEINLRNISKSDLFFSLIYISFF